MSPPPPPLPPLKAFTVTVSLVVSARAPEVPVIITIAEPGAAVLLALNVSPLVPDVGFVANVAVTPLGRPDAARVTMPVNAPFGVTVIVLVALLPAVTVNWPGELDRLKVGDPAAIRSAIRSTPFMLPHPVVRS
jgi:hypothetical protein